MSKEHLESVVVSLNNKDLWDQFNNVGTEMIITKTGRRMFPPILVDVSCLEAEARYFILLELCSSSDYRYKFDSKQWVPAGKVDTNQDARSCVHIHPDSPAVGSYWMSQAVNFQKVKLTNCSTNRGGHMLLTSMRKYVPKIHIVKASDILAIKWSPTATFTFSEAEFIAVTAYQNQSITTLKIYNNPFAKGFRHTGKSRHRRKSGGSLEGETEEKRLCPTGSPSLSVDEKGRLPLAPHSFVNDNAEARRDETTHSRSHPYVNVPPISWNQPLVYSTWPHSPYRICADTALCYLFHQRLFYHAFPFPYHPHFLRQHLFPSGDSHLIDLSTTRREHSEATGH